MRQNPDSEAALEAEALTHFAELGWETVYAEHEIFGPAGTLGRETRGEVVLLRHLRPALERLNPHLPPAALDAAAEELTRDRSALSLVRANQEVYDSLKDGVRVVYVHDGEEQVEHVRVVDWDAPAHNHFLMVSQLWVTGEMYTRRADLVGFVNGLPLVFFELKAHHKRLENAYRDNLRDYKDTIPHLFWYNAFVVLSNGSEARVGSITAPWGHFGEWKRVDSEGEQGVISLETVIRGTCTPARLLDIAENFVLFDETRGELGKLVAKNHQYLGVNNAVEAVRQLRENRGRLGVFWHTQGSGKSYSMIFFAQKVMRKLPGNWTFLVITDRVELDEQIYKNFAGAGVVTEPHVQAESGEHLQQLLREDHRYVFTLIQKFRTEGGAAYPTLTDRSDIVVITDEAHRSQYDVFAANMRAALPNAAFIAFTGTPLMAGEEKTREVFGDYLSVYNFAQSAADGATVPLFYENRIPELQLTNPDLNEHMAELLDEAMLDEAQEEAVEREFAREYHLITRDDRLEKIAEDLVAHFMGRGIQGKAMVVAVDRMTAVRMYDKVQAHWRRYRDDLQAQAVQAAGAERAALEAKVRYMDETDMAVVVSQAQNEIADFRAKGLDIEPHRRRMVSEDLATKFKDPDDPLRIVFVCAMWMTGFDVPACSTIYLDKPMRNHTLMQTIARANRVFGEKDNGFIVDYIGVFRDLQRALAIYGTGPDGSVREGESPIADKSRLVDALRELLGAARSFLADCGVALDTIMAAEGFARVRAMEDARDAVLFNDETKQRFLDLARDVDKLYKAILPHHAAHEFGRDRAVLAVLAEKIRALDPEADIAEVMDAVEALLDSSVAAEAYVIRDTERLVDLSKVDFEALKARFERGRKHTEVERLRGAINSKLQCMVRLNRTRMNYLEQFTQMIEAYNEGAHNVDLMFELLVDFAQALNAEDQRHIAEQLSEEELAVFDLLTRPAMSLTSAEERQVKKVARELLETLKREKLVLDWRKRQRTRAAVRLCIEEMLDNLPAAYTSDLYAQKCEAVYQHVYEAYFGQGRSVYAPAA